MKYELTLLLNEEKELANIKNRISLLKGRVIKEENWGEKILAYSIKKSNKAHFYNFIVEIDRKQTTDLKKKLNFNEKLIRYLLLIKN